MPRFDSIISLAPFHVSSVISPSQAGSLDAARSKTRGAAQSVLRVGVLGAGRMARHHVQTILKSSGVALVAVADPSATARESIGALAPSARLFESLDQMLRDEALDIVHIVTPPDTHHAAALAALEAGCHIYVEKPFASSVKEATQVLELAEREGLIVCAGHQLLFEGPTRVVDRFLPVIGRVVHVESYFSFRTVRRAPGGRVPLRPDLQLLDILPHPVYMLLHFLERCAVGKTEMLTLDISEGGTVHAIIRRGSLSASLVVTLEGRPVESYLRVVGTNGALVADYVSGTVERRIGAGGSAIDKVLAPYRRAWQLPTQAIRALMRRVLTRNAGYAGVPELVQDFYRAVREASASPLSPWSLVETTRICEEVATRLAALRTTAAKVQRHADPTVVVTGGTGFLGRALVKELVGAGEQVRVLARREPATWDRITGAEYRVADIGQPLAPELFTGARIVIHAAAETAGGWSEHQRNSVDGTANVMRAAAAGGVRQAVHVSSIAVLARAQIVDENTPLESRAHGVGPYVWGKLESERVALQLAGDLGLDIRVVRPGPIVDHHAFEPPGRLGKRVGNLFVAAGSPGQRLGVVEVSFAAAVLRWIAQHFERTPGKINLLSPAMVTRRELITRLKHTNPDISVLWLPTPLLVPLSWLAVAAQKLLRPNQPVMNVARAFASQRYDTTLIAALAKDLDTSATLAPR